ncbi:hypothetical protein ACFYXS_39030 [Streptomyces sp. NPDC002574]|uniref:hypothetical protein n=1 Tax=Streptomyces sp. NPDC002574 TaxID=3364652 RepID=UPI0036BFB19C
MPKDIRVLAKDVTKANHHFIPHTDFSGQAALTIVYTGIIRLDWNVGDKLAGATVTSFVPFRNGSVLDLGAFAWEGVATASLSGWHLYPESDALQTLDTAQLDEASQPKMNTTGKTPTTLVLRLDLGGVHARTLAIPYQATITLKAHESPSQGTATQQLQDVINGKHTAFPQDNEPEGP